MYCGALSVRPQVVHGAATWYQYHAKPDKSYSMHLAHLVAKTYSTIYMLKI